MNEAASDITGLSGNDPNQPHFRGAALNAAFIAVLIGVAATVAVLLNGGRPRSPLYYPFIALLALGPASLVLFRKGVVATTTKLPMPAREAVPRSVLTGATAGTIYFLFNYLLGPVSRNFWMAAIAFGLTMGLFEFLSLLLIRPPRRWRYSFLAAGFVFLIVGFLIALKSGK